MEGLYNYVNGKTIGTQKFVRYIEVSFVEGHCTSGNGGNTVMSAWFGVAEKTEQCYS